MATAATGAATHDTRGDTGFFGHPKGLRTLFFTEMFERFSYYGMRAFLVLYITASVGTGGLGMSMGDGGLIYGLYGSSVYLMSLPGGWLADRFLGQRRAVFVGGCLIMSGHAVLALPAVPGFHALLAALPANASFYAGLALIVFGTGLLKPNISTMVGQLYSKDDPRRDAGFTIFYMGINTGALIAPILCGTLIAKSKGFRSMLADGGIDPNHAWHFGFGLAAIGMGVGLIQYWKTQHYLGDAGLHPVRSDAPTERARNQRNLFAVLAAAIGIPVLFFTLVGTGAIHPSKAQVGDVFGVGLTIASVVLFGAMWRMAQNADERKRLIAMMVLFLGCITFFGVFEMAGGVINLFTDSYARPEVLGIPFPATTYQSVNSAWVLLLAPLFVWLWLRSAKSGKEPSSVAKFGAGMVFNAIAIAVLIPALMIIDKGTITMVDGTPHIDAAHQISPLFIIVMYMFSTMGELCVSPVGLSSMNKLAPRRMAGMVMGIWFLATSIGIYFSGRASEVAESKGNWFLFELVIVLSLVVAAALFAVAGPIKKMLAGAAKEEDGPLPPAEVPSAQIVDG